MRLQRLVEHALQAPRQNAVCACRAESFIFSRLAYRNQCLQLIFILHRVVRVLVDTVLVVMPRHLVSHNCLPFFLLVVESVVRLIGNLLPICHDQCHYG